MMSFGASGDALLATTVYGCVYLVELDFTTGTLYYTTNVLDIITANGHTYIGKGNLFDVSPLTESENSADEKIVLSVSIVNSGFIAAGMGDVTNYRGRAVRLYAQLIGPTFIPVGEPEFIWRGYMEPVQIERKTSEDGPSSGRISLPCRRAGMARSRKAEGLRLSDAQQQADYPGDKGYEFLQTLIDQPQPLLTKAFQVSGAQ